MSMFGTGFGQNNQQQQQQQPNAFGQPSTFGSSGKFLVPCLRLTLTSHM